MDLPPWIPGGVQYGLVALVVWVLLRVNADLRASLRAEQQRNAELVAQVMSILGSVRDSLSPLRSRQR